MTDRARRPPAEVWVSWCATCGSPELADREKRTPSRYSCSLCPVGKGHIRVTRYAVAGPRFRTVKRSSR